VNDVISMTDNEATRTTLYEDQAGCNDAVVEAEKFEYATKENSCCHAKQAYIKKSHLHLLGFLCSAVLCSACRCYLLEWKRGKNFSQTKLIYHISFMFVDYSQ